MAGGALSNFTANADNTVWTATFTKDATADAPSITVADGSYTDLAGNEGSGDSQTWTADVVAPTLEITTDNATVLASGETAGVTFTFTEAVEGFDISDVVVAGGALSNFTANADNTVWTATFTKDATADAPSITVADGSYTDLAGNEGAGDSQTWTADVVAPTLEITTENDTVLAIGETSLL